MRDRLQVAAAAALAPARGGDLGPVRVRRRRRQQRLDALEHGFGAVNQGFEVGLRCRHGCVAKFRTGPRFEPGVRLEFRRTCATQRKRSSAAKFEPDPWRSLIRPVVGVDRHVVVREVARPHGGGCLAAAEIDAHGDLVLLHHALAVLLAVTRRASAVVDHQHVVEPERHARRIGIRRRRVADRADDAAEIGIRREERGLHQRRMRDAERDAPALVDVPPAVDADRDELGGAFAVAHDRLRERDRAFLDRARESARAARRRRRRSARASRAPSPRARSCRWSTCRRRPSRR